MKIYQLPTPVQVLNKLITHVRVQDIHIDFSVPSVTVDVTLHTSAEEEIPAFSTSIPLTGTDYIATGVSESAIVSKTRTALNI
jgi:hypothetical protein